MKVTDGQSFIGDAHALLALRAIPNPEGLLAFSALPDAPVTPVREPGRVRRVVRWSARPFGRPVRRTEESPRERPCRITTGTHVRVDGTAGTVTVRH